MITEYIKGNPTTIYDTNRGLYQTDYCNNLGHIIQKKNEIEILSRQIEKCKETIEIQKQYIESQRQICGLIYMVEFIWMPSLIMCLIVLPTLGIMTIHVPIFRVILTILISMMTFSFFRYFHKKEYKKAIKNIESLKQAIPELEKEKQQKEAELLKLKKESRKQESIEEKINMASFNQTYRQQLETKLDELMALKCNDKGISLGLSFKKPNN